jgi:methylase of polypeptide subunit release factors
MLNHGFEKVYGTDSNPNVIIGLTADVKKNNLKSKLELIHADLSDGLNLKTELIVFNPPWLPATYNLEGLDSAIYYKDDLFSRFFAEVGNYLLPGGKIVLLFSNLAEVTGMSKVHPIKKELGEGERFRKEYFVRKKVQAASKKTRRHQHWRDSEMVELWVLKTK